MAGEPLSRVGFRLPPAYRVRTLPRGWLLVPLDRAFVKGDRVALVTPDLTQAIVVWRSRWRESMRAIYAGKPVPTAYRAPALLGGPPTMPGDDNP